MDILSLFIMIVLIGLNAFFVAAEFAFIRVRKTRVEQLAEEGSRKANAVKKIITDMDLYVSTLQLAITMCALALGVVGGKSIEFLVVPVIKVLSLPQSVEHTVVVTFSFLLVTFFTVVVGELAPKTIAIQNAEKIAMFSAKPIIALRFFSYPFVWCLNKSSYFILMLFGIKNAKNDHDSAHSEEELLMIFNESFKSGEINQSEYKYVNNIFEFDNRLAKEIMVPRTEVVVIDLNSTVNDCLAVFKEQNFTRYLIIDGDKDHVIGMINAKEVLTEFAFNKAENKSIESFIRPIIRVIDSTPIHSLLLKMQKERIHIAALMDEYGGTSGIVTVEDIIEEIVGEIRDEFDSDEINEIRIINEDTFIVDAKVLVSQINDLLNIEIDDEDIDTIGGWILTENYDAKNGDIIEYGNYKFKVIEMEEHQIRYLEITRTN